MKRFDLGMGVVVLALAVVTVILQFEAFGDWIIDEQIVRHDAVMDGTAGSPWAYRLLSEWPLEGLLAITTPTTALVVVRLVQNVAIFAMMAAYLRRWQFNERLVIGGLGLLAFAFTQAHFRADLALNTYSDVLAYLAGGWLVLAGRARWLVPLVVVAVASRETALLIPLLALARPSREATKIAVVGLVAGALTYAAIRGVVGSRFPVPGAPGHVAGWNMVLYNLRWRSLTELSHVLTIAPLGILWMRRWAPELRRMFWLIVPLWVVAHLAGAVVAEARLFLVPLALVLIPGFLSWWRPGPLDDTDGARVRQGRPHAQAGEIEPDGVLVATGDEGDRRDAPRVGTEPAVP